MSESSHRLPFPTSSEEFALPSTSSAASSTSADDGLPNPLFLRLRRPTLPNKSSYYSDKRIQSPLAISFTVPSRRRGSNGEESESDRERMWSESSPSSSSGNPTPPITLPLEGDDESNASTRSGRPSPSTPPPSRSLSTNVLLAADAIDTPIPILRRPTYPLKPPRILNLLAEPRPEEDELQSEAAFQRLLASYSGLPSQPRTPRAPSDRGRYPEEVGHEDSHEDLLSDDDEDDDVQGLFAFDAQNETISTKPCTPAQSVSGDDLSMSLAESPMGVAMDVDPPMVSPSITSTPMSNQWRYTPPPTTSAVRSNKRKLDDRYDPYPTSAKRRAVSPSISYLRETHPSLVSYPRTPRPPVPIPLSIPPSNSSTSATSSPTVTSGYPFQAYPSSRQVNLGTMSLSSSPVLRPSLGLVSPILRPILRTRRGADGEEREIEGAGEAVNGLSLG
ncbi:hypothetical protein CY34DRAFT_798222 [Suillus luteus UH-Slu-Lm8-n1]|uniref:Uncharacterized protein n=1 Tax=Suillus luteus UH-Slu-Lm8-n1 TaxID=930992 RepID=A0A0D0BRV4_9AGAM|nr:hypothetical protein CY34DRAFT_798222 [Suillus luteus UH-Slu-Lm8-n1]